MMLTVILIYFIGKRFYDLAEDYKQNKWLFAVLGVIMYYVGAFIGGLLLGVLIIFTDLEIDLENNLLMSLIALPFGLLAIYGFYYLLKNRCEKTEIVIKDEINDIGKNFE